MGRVFFNTRKNMQSLTAAYTVIPSDSGKTFVLNASAGAGITLPSVADMQEGWNCRFIVGTAFATTDWVVTATAAIMRGGINDLEGGADTVDGPSTTGGTTITFELGKETVGDFVDLECDGTNIYINGQNVLIGGITLA